MGKVSALQMIDISISGMRGKSSVVTEAVTEAEWIG